MERVGIPTIPMVVDEELLFLAPRVRYLSIEAITSFLIEKGKLIEEVSSGGKRGGVALGGGGNMSTIHVMNFFDAIRDKAVANASIDDANYFDGNGTLCECFLEE